VSATISRLFVEMRGGVSLTFFPTGWPQIASLPISVSQVAGIKGGNYHAWPQFRYFLAHVVLFNVLLKTLKDVVNYEVLVLLALIPKPQSYFYMIAILVFTCV
jgi:hypothetical protein